MSKIIKGYHMKILITISILILTFGLSSEAIKKTDKAPCSLALHVGQTTLNKDTDTTLKVTATYRDGSIEDITDKVQWIITPKGAVRIKGHTLTALKDGNVTLQAKVGRQVSNPVILSIYWEVDGHRLPPEPDPKINNATLLGVDVNDNGVRDDVERWIYERYKDKHPIHIDIAMQAARGYKLVLEKQPKTKEEAKVIRSEVDSIITCEGYYMVYAKYFNEPLLLKERIDNVVEYKYYNTDQRKKTYIEYDELLSGDTYPTAKIDINMKNACDFNTSRYEE